MKQNIIIAMLAVVIIVLLVKRDPMLVAGVADSGNGVVAVTGKTVTGQEDVLFVIDTKKKRVLVYKVENGVQLKLLSVRDYTYEVELEEYKNAEPSVLDMEKAYKQQEMRKRMPKP